jgi:hypothetical protein
MFQKFRLPPGKRPAMPLRFDEMGYPRTKGAKSHDSYEFSASGDEILSTEQQLDLALEFIIAHGDTSRMQDVIDLPKKSAH